MTPAQKDMAELGLDEQALAERQEHISQLLNGKPEPKSWNEAAEQALISVGVALMDKCPVCHKPAVFENRNRLANCGHVRRSHGKLVPRDEQKSRAIAQQPTPTLATQVSRLKDLYETKMSRIAELETINDEIQDLSDRHAHLLGEIDGLSEDIEAAWLELQGKGK